MMYQDLAWPDKDNYYNYDHSIKVFKDPGPESFYFWSIQFWMQNGKAGYMGIQTDVNDNSGQNIGKGFNVAIWSAIDANPAQNAHVRPNTDGQPGRALYMPYEWEENTEYRIRVWSLKDQPDPGAIWWGFWIKNESTQVETYIGAIKNPNTEFMSSASVVWTEYYGPDRDAPCNSKVRKPAAVMFENPVRNDGSTLPTSTDLRTPKCPNFLITDRPDFSCDQEVISPS